MIRDGNRIPVGLSVTIVADSADPIELRGFTQSGSIRRTITPAADGSQTTVTMNIDDFPIMLSLIDTDDLYLAGACWASISLMLNNQIIANLATGFIYREKGLTWPPVTHQDQIPGRGLIGHAASSNPAAGVNASITVPAGELWRVLAGSVQLVTDSQAGDRHVKLVFSVSGGVTIRIFSNVAHGVSSTLNYHYAHFSPPTDEQEGDDVLAGIPQDLFLTPASTITTEVDGFQSGDNFSILTVQIEKFFDRVV
jgi:hypothetical protein